jgi:hypothetical protein
MRTRCPCCGTTSSLDVLVAHEDARAALATVFGLAQPLGTAMVRYLSLHRPATRELTMARVATLVGELLPALKSGSIPRKGRDWPVTSTDWVQAIELTMAARDAGKLTLPLTGHGYLFEVLASLADKAERAQEQALEAERRSRGQDGAIEHTVTVRGQTMSIGQGLEQVFGGKDPELAKLDNDMRNAAPMPAAQREKAQAIRADSYLVRKMKAELRTNHPTV